MAFFNFVSFSDAKSKELLPKQSPLANNHARSRRKWALRNTQCIASGYFCCISDCCSMCIASTISFGNAPLREMVHCHIRFHGPRQVKQNGTAALQVHASPACTSSRVELQNFSGSKNVGCEESLISPECLLSTDFILCTGGTGMPCTISPFCWLITWRCYCSVWFQCWRCNFLPIWNCPIF